MALVRIEIEGLKLFGYHGVYEEERQGGQHFEFDVICEVERPSGQDELGSTLDYVEVMNVIREVNSSDKFKLLETLAERVMERLLEKFATISSIEICVRKHLRLTGVDVDRVGVSIKRTRTELE